MALDALAIRCLVQEFQKTLTNGRIDKIHQPEKDEIWIGIRTFTNNYKLIMSANASQPRIHFTAESKKNPMTAPLFCMLMRKHAAGGKIVNIEQCGFERIIRFDIETYDELGDLTQKHIFIEIMGRHSNIILTHADMKIIDAIKHIDFTVSSVRQVLPGIMYTLPPVQDKFPLISEETAQLKLDFSFDGKRPDQIILQSVSGISPLTAREIVYCALGQCTVVCGELTDTDKEKLSNTLASFAEQCRNNAFSPCILFDTEAEKIIEFSSIPIQQYGSMLAVQPCASMNETLDRFYSTRDKLERMKQKSADLVKLLHTNLERVSKKIIIQRKTLTDAEKKEKWKIYGDLLTANLYQAKAGMDSVTVENYYEPDCPSVKIALSPQLTPSQNAQKYYKRYNKAKTAETEAAKQLENAFMEKEYLESTLVSVQNAQDEADLNAIRTELAEQGYIKRKTAAKKNKQQSSSKPAHFVSSDGFDIYVGKNNTQNDYLTLRLANASDIWFHTKNIHGSHTVIKLGITKEVPDRTILEAASLAAYYSKARESSQVPVDYTQIKNVHKPNGAKPGMVIYDHYNTVYVTPKLPKNAAE